MKRHFENLTKMAARAITHWWLFLIAGVLCVLTGIAVFVFPLESYVTLSIIFGILLLITGAAKLITAATSGNYFLMKGYVIIGGMLDLILGIFLCVYPGITLMLLPVMMGFWMMYNSFMFFSFADDLGTMKVPGGGLITTGAILLLLLSVLVLLNPLGAGIATVVVLAGSGLVVFGFMLCSLSVKLKEIHTNFDMDTTR